VSPPRDPASSVRGPASSARRPANAPPARQRSWAEVRWRQFRNPPRPIVRAVLSSLIVAIVLALAYLAYDVALSRGTSLAGGDLRVLAIALYIGIVLLSGTLITYLVVPRPTGAGGPAARSRRSAWSAALGFFASVPIAYLVMVVATQIVRPLFDA